MHAEYKLNETLLKQIYTQTNFFLDALNVRTAAAQTRKTMRTAFSLRLQLIYGINCNFSKHTQTHL